MDCGIPFCNNGCPLGNLIPDWNDLVYRDHWRDAIERLHATNNFPEFTGRLCPAPCEAACVLGISQDPVTIKQVEVEIVERAWSEGLDRAGGADRAHRPQGRGRRLGPGRARRRAAAHARRARRRRVRARRPHRRAAALRHPRVQDGEAPPRPASRADGGRGHRVPGERQRRRRRRGRQLREEFDAIVLAGGATAWRDLPIPGRELGGIHQAMEFLPWGNRVQQGDLDEPPITAEGKHVVIIGGGDTGADCLGTSHRQGAVSVHQFEILPRPPDDAGADQPVAHVVERLPRVVGARGRRRARLQRQHRVLPRRRRRQRPRAARARGRDGRRQVREDRGHRLRAAVRARAAGHGLPRSGAGRPARAARGRARRARQRGARPARS